MSGMKDQIGDCLFGDLFTRHTDPSTSHKAADKAKRGVTAAKRKVLLIHGTAALGLVDGELLAKWKLRWPGVKESVPRKRRGDLVRDGLVCDSGIKRTFEKCECIVWTLTKAGREAFMKLQQQED